MSHHHHPLYNLPPELRAGRWAISLGLDDKAPRHPIYTYPGSSTLHHLDRMLPEGGINDKGKQFPPWATFEQVVASSAPLAGVLIQKELGVVLIDLDNPNKPGKELGQKAREGQASVWARFESYAETSASGNGAHILVRADWDDIQDATGINLGTNPEGKGVEVYGDLSYCICTGNVLKPLPIVDHHRLLGGLVVSLHGDQSPHSVKGGEGLVAVLTTRGERGQRRRYLRRAIEPGSDIPGVEYPVGTAEELWKRLDRARNGGVAISMFRDGYRPNDDRSAIDAAFCERLCHFRPTFDAYLEVFQHSALWRDDKRHTFQAYVDGYLWPYYADCMCQRQAVINEDRAKLAADPNEAKNRATLEAFLAKRQAEKAQHLAEFEARVADQQAKGL